MERATDSLPVASIWSRFVAWIVDILLFWALMIIALVVGALSYAVHPALGGIGVLAAFAAIVLTLNLTWWREGVQGASIGKSVMGIWVVDVAAGHPIGPSRAFGRRILRVGAVSAPFHSRQRGLHDLVFGSLVTSDTFAEQHQRMMDGRKPIRMPTPTGWATGYPPTSDGSPV